MAWLCACLALALLLAGCAGTRARAVDEGVVTGHMALDYATQFDVAYRSDGTSLLTIGNDRYLLVPREEGAPAGGGGAPATNADGGQGEVLAPEGTTVIRYPIQDVYLAASSAMDFFRQLGALDAIGMTSTKAQDWSLPQVAQAIERGDMLYVGKYSAPDYEAILTNRAQLAIESTMVYHAPEVTERLTALGIPSMVERSSYESSPLGRLEWIKLYGLLVGRLDEASEFFDQQVALVGDLRTNDAATRPTVAFFSLRAGGGVTVRRPGDYVSQMIDMAGGRYFLQDEADSQSALSTMSMEMESFYEQARDADVIVYNSAIDDELASVDDLLAKSPLLADFAAVRSGNVWCTGKDLFQQPTCLAGMIADMRKAFFGGAEGDAAGEDAMEHLYKVRRDSR